MIIYISLEGREKAARVIFSFLFTLLIIFLAVVMGSKWGIFGQEEENMTYWVHVLPAMYIPTLVAFINCLVGLGLTDLFYDFVRQRLLLSSGYTLVSSQSD